MLKSRRITALITAFAFAFAFCFSVLFIVEEAEHNCSGEHCNICEQINACLHFFDNFSPKPEALGFSASLFFAAVLLIGAVAESKKNITLVNLKVKLSD